MKILLLSVFFISFSTYASEFKSLEAKKLAEQLVRSINFKMQKITELELAAGSDKQDINITLNQKESFDSGRFGALIDKKVLGKVLTVTPGSQADKLGLKSGDLLLAINHTPIEQPGFDWRSSLQYIADKTPILLSVSRNNEQLTLRGQFSAQYIPSWQLVTHNSKKMTAEINDKACGRIFVGFRPKNTDRERLQTEAGIHSIDGIRKNMALERFKLTPGQHDLKIFRKFGSGKQEMTIDIEANKNYYLLYKEESAAKNGYIKTKIYAPVIHAVEHQLCEL